MAQQNFGLVQIESIRRQQNICNLKTEILFVNVRKHCRKRKKCCLPAFSPFPQRFQKVSFPGSLKTWDCVAKS